MKIVHNPLEPDNPKFVWIWRIIVVILLLWLAVHAHAQNNYDANGNLLVNCGACGGGGAGGGTSSSFGSPFPANGTAAGFKDTNGNMAGGLLDMSGNLLVDVASIGTVTVTGTVTANQGGAPWSVSQSGTWTVQQGTPPWSVSQSGSWNVGLNAGSNNIGSVNQGTSPWVVSGTVTANQGGAPWSVSQSGTWTVQQGTPPWSVSQSGSPWGQNLLQWDSVSLGAPSSYGTSPGPVTVPGVNAFVTNPQTITGTVIVSETNSQLPQGEMIAPLSIYGPPVVGVPAQNTVEIAAVYSANPPTVQKGQAIRLQTDANGNLLTHEAIAAPPIQANIADAVGLRPSYGPCLYLARQPFVINTSSNVVVATGSANKKIAVCDWSILPAAAAANVALVEGTGVTCGTGTVGMQGGATAASGANVATNGGFIQAANPNGDPWGITATQGDTVCLFVSAAVSGVINFVGPF